MDSNVLRKGIIILQFIFAIKEIESTETKETELYQREGRNSSS